MKKLTHKEWKALESKEMAKEEKIEEYCEEVLGNTKPVKKRIEFVREIFEKV